jgi:hypothetical protein
MISIFPWLRTFFKLILQYFPFMVFLSFLTPKLKKYINDNIDFCQVIHKIKHKVCEKIDTALIATVGIILNGSRNLKR